MYLSSLIPTLVNEFVDGNTTVENIHVQMFVILGGVVLVGTLVSSAISLSLSVSICIFIKVLVIYILLVTKKSVSLVTLKIYRYNCNFFFNM